MKEKELRLALVLFGGVSLAIYQHGINREVLNLLRASRAYHDAPSHAAKQAPGRRFVQGDGSAAGEDARTAMVYFDLLRQLGRFVDLRVLVDVVSGSSAGAINGIALARAIAHDLSLAPLTSLWLDEADMLRLLAPEARAKPWDKWYFRPLLRPFLSWLRREGMLPPGADREMLHRMLMFVRSRWFRPPLDGERLSALLLDGFSAMGDTNGSGRTLLSSGTRLSLAVTVTDYRGFERTLFTHDPPTLAEREHRHQLQFGCEHRRGGVLESELDLANVPSLAFAARASASYPGAFPPARLHEMDALLAARGRPWLTRARFLVRNFAHYREQQMNPEELVLIDGSVLDNKPITAAVRNIRAHRAFREVDRRLIFIDPHADPRRGAPDSEDPGWFETLRGALSDLPRHQPVHSELAEIGQHNRQIRRLKLLIAETRPQIDMLVEQATGGALARPFGMAELRHWRLTSTNRLRSSPLVYNAWMRGLVLESLDFLVAVLCRHCGYALESPAGRWVQQVIERWAGDSGVLPADYQIDEDVQEDGEMPFFARMIIAFGIEYKRRRINFVLHEVNALYEFCSPGGDGGLSSATLDAVKTALHGCLDDLAVYEGSDFVTIATRASLRRLLRPGGDEAGAAVVAGLDPAAFAAEHRETLAVLIERLGSECGIGASNAKVEAALMSPGALAIDAHNRRKLLNAYLGYFYWDVILRPSLQALALGVGPLEEVLVDRISPRDATTLAAAGEGRQRLMGTAFGSFGGFLSRKARENDYLWGRLDAADRLIDIVASAVAGKGGLDAAALQAFKKRAFEAILADEATRLAAVPELLASVRAAVAAL